MNKYEKLMIELKNEYDIAYSEYSEKMHAAHAQAQKACNAYNDNIHRINATRDNLLEEIYSLYKFLKNLGTIDKQITPFDYATESSQSVESSINRDRLSHDPSCHSTSGFVKTATAVSIVVAPVLTPVIWFGNFLHKRSKCKEEYLKMVNDFEEQQTTWEKDIADKNADGEFYKTASEIAFLYQALIVTVRHTIRENILPELSGIDVFLIADAIKNNIISNLDPSDAEVAKIMMYKDTIYDCHYTFVQNAFDFYELIVNFFSEPILTKMMDDNKITFEEKTEFKNKKASIESKANQLIAESVFGGKAE